MADDLQSYKLQLQQVEAALLTNPENSELLKLKTDLGKAIALTEDLIRTPPRSGAGAHEVFSFGNMRKTSSKIDPKVTAPASEIVPSTPLGFTFNSLWLSHSSSTNMGTNPLNVEIEEIGAETSLGRKNVDLSANLAKPGPDPKTSTASDQPSEQRRTSEMEIRPLGSILLDMETQIVNLKNQLKTVQDQLSASESQNNALKLALQDARTTPPIPTSRPAPFSFQPSNTTSSFTNSNPTTFLSSTYTLPTSGTYNRGTSTMGCGITSNHVPSTSSSNIPYDIYLRQNEHTNTSTNPPHTIFPRKIQDLPAFSGQPEEWPAFYNAFVQSTTAYQYTNLENNYRLQKSLNGVARETVKSLLIHPDNVDAAMDQLRFRFGRPELLIRSQLNEIREIQVISENAVSRIIEFSTKVKNLSVFLQSVNANQHLANPTLLEELISKLPMSKKLEWAKCAVQVQPYPTVLHFSQWLSDLANLICVVQDIEMKDPKRRTPILHAAHHVSYQNCIFCECQHTASECSKFIDLTVPERWDVVKRHRLCFACLRKGHSMLYCRGRKQCSVNNCQKKHHPLLHEDEKSCGTITEQIKQEEKEVPLLAHHVTHCFKNVNNTEQEAVTNDLLFRVLPVTLYGSNKEVNVYALFDEGSSITMMDADLIQELGLQGQRCQLNMQWISGRQAQEPTTLLNLYVSGAGKNKKHLLKNVYALHKLDLPRQSLNDKDLRAVMAKVNMLSYTNVKPKLLIGLDNCHLGLPREIVPLKPSGPYASNTELGWLVFGQAAKPTSTTTSPCLFTQGTSNESLHMLVADFFEIENFGVRPSPPIESKFDMRAKQILQSTTKRINHRYQTGLLWKSDNIVLPESYSMALKRLVGIERKMKRNENFGAAYRTIIKDYVSKNYARKLEKEEVAVYKPKTWYLPHFGVVNPNKPTKIRLVFDAAAEANGTSLNSFLLKGPQQYRSLPSILFHFREGPVAVCGDIKEMFHQVLIRPEDRCAQRFLWRDGDDTRQPDIYEMMVMTFGAACSPCAAEYVKTSNAKEHLNNDTRAIKSILEFHYVDDFVDSFQSVEEAINISQQVRDIHKDAGFELRNFSSNSKVVLETLEGENVPLVVGSKSSPYTEKILGMYWKPVSDTFCYQIRFHHVEKDVIAGERIPTKRELLSVVMSIFDPLGFLNQFTINAKLLMREVWRHDIQWDEPLPREVITSWTNWLRILPDVASFELPRFYFQGGLPRTIQLHVFVDSSEEAFAAVAYWRIENDEGKIYTSFVCSKTKCAPLKTLTIPRLELQAAVLGSRLMRTVIEEHSFNICKIALWSDSTTVLNWISSEHRRYKPFVAHRIAEIINNTDPSCWRWVPTRENPADDATRNTMVDLKTSSRWSTGPSFLLDKEENWPRNTSIPPYLNIDEELRPKFALVIVSAPFIEFNRFSSLYRLIRTTAYVLRFINLCRKRSHERAPSAELSLVELNAAEMLLCRQAQSETFAIEINQITLNQPLPKGSALYNLSPYIDNDGLLRVYGRIDAASCLTYAAKRPIILPSAHTFTTLVVQNQHYKMKHQNTDATICEIRQKYWIPRLRQTLRKVISACPVCKIARARPIPPLMGPLPEDRLTPFVRPFSYTGLDFFGPFTVSIGRRTEKRWVALFTCLSIRAIHLEVVRDLSTDACILAIRNFINRRGVPLKIRSDNGTNFVGVSNESKRFSGIFECDRLEGELTAKGVEWVFNCPANPAEGGVWERMVQCVKRVLQHTLKETSPQEFTFQSLMIEAENVVNSRPLTHIPISPDQEEPLTPNHFILGSANTAQTPPADEPEEAAWRLRKQWRISRQLRDRFWKKWVAEYLPTLTRRTKWCQRTKPVAIGDLVFLCDASVPRKQWCRGRIENVYPGADGHIRRVDVRTSNGLIQRPVSKLAVLDVEDSESVSIHGGGDVD